VEGTTTTQLNVRAEPSTASQTLGMLDPFATVQILAKDAGGNWYQILYPAGSEGKGWLTARYVQVPQGQEVPPLAGAPGAESGPSGVVTQQVNVRSGPGTSFEALGTLNPQDTVTLTGKNPDGTWLQVAFSGATGGLGWIAAGYIQSTETGGLPIINERGQTLGTGTPDAVPATPTPTLLPATADGDSASSPAARMAFSPSGAGSLQFSSDISIPEGDAEDWVAFIPYSAPVSIQLDCLGSQDIAAELLRDVDPVPAVHPITCGEQRTLTLAAGASYLLHLHFPLPTSGLQYTRFTLFITSLR
jgi:uncharacterized protein YraI